MTADGAQPEPRKPDSGARGRLGAILVLLVLAGAGLLWSSSTVWSVLIVQRDAPLPPLAYAVDGSGAASMVTAGGFIMLAAVVAVLATKTFGRRLVAVVVLATVALAGVGIMKWTGQSHDEREASMLVDGVRYAVEQAPEESSTGIVLAFIALALAAVAGVLLLVTKAQVLMGAKYERAGASASTQPVDDDPQARDRDLWKSLDRGEDPTD